MIANTGDDIEVHGVHVSPDPDLVTYWLADVIDERGWGIRGDTWEVMAALARAARPTWFQLGDRDLAMCLVRTEILRQGGRLTVAQGEVARALGVGARVLPMADEPVRTEVRVAGAWRPFQQFMIVDRAAPPVEGVAFRGAETARPTPEVLAALDEAEAIVIGPSNPIASIGPILALPGLREALADATAPVVGVSPFVAGAVIKGPTEAFMLHAGLPPGAAGAAQAYAGLLDGLVADEPVEAVRVRQESVLMDSAGARRRVAAATLDFAASLAG